MKLQERIIGYVMYAWSKIDSKDGQKIKIMTFGPICIHPDYQRQGYGKILLDYSMEKAKKMGAGCLLIFGNVNFYGKSGFIPAYTKGIVHVDDLEGNSPCFLCKELEDNFLNGISGTYKDPDGYFVAEKNPKDFEQYELTFPHKEKLILPNQLP